MTYRELWHELQRDVIYENFMYLWQETLQLPKYQLASRWGDEVPQEILAKFRDLQNGISVQYLVGHCYFYGLKLAVDPRVLIPRFDTEVVVEAALQYITPNSRVVDLGTGSGAIALAIKQQEPRCEVVAADVSLAALEVARANANHYQFDIDFIQSDWFSNVMGKFDVIVSNPPYLTNSDDIARDVLENEPHLALFSPEGIGAYQIIINEARGHLTAHGVLILEIDPARVNYLTAYAKQLGFSYYIKNDLSGKARVMVLR